MYNMNDNVLNFPDLGDDGPEEPLVLEFDLDTNQSPQIIIELLIKLNASVGTMATLFGTLIADNLDISAKEVHDYYHERRRNQVTQLVADLKKRYPPPSA
jgi:hypothetical protein